MYADFDLVIPPSLDAALQILSKDKTAGLDSQPLAGGTNMIVDMRARRVTPAKLIGLGELEELRGIRTENNRVVIGGRTTMTDILNSRDLVQHSPSLVEQARVFAGQMVRNTATVAGNICSGSPAADVVPPLLALDAEVTLASAGGTRMLPLNEFYLDYKSDQRAKDELMTEIAWPLPAERSSNRFYKLARRRGDAITMVGIAVALTVEDGVCSSARIALGAVAPTPRRAIEAETILTGRTLDPDRIDAAAQKAADEINPIDDIRATAAYRRHCVQALTRRLVTQIWDELT